MRWAATRGNKGWGSPSLDRRMVNVEAAGNLAHRLAAVAPLDRLALLVRGELRLAAHFHVTRFGTLAAFACACPDQVAIELCKTT